MPRLAGARLGATHLLLGQRDELPEDLRFSFVEATPTSTVAAAMPAPVPVRNTELTTQRMEPLYIGTVASPGARLLDLAIDPAMGASLGVALPMRVAFVGRLHPAIGDAHDLLVIAPCVENLAPRFGYPA